MERTSSNTPTPPSGQNQSGARFQALLDTSSAAIVVITPEWELIDFNDAWCHFLGYQRSELMGVSPRELTHPEDLEQSHDQLQRLIGGGSDTYRVEKRYLTKNGEVVWGDLSAKGVKDGTGSVDAIVATIVDITQQKRQEAELTRSLARFRDFAEIASDWFWETDDENRFTWFSEDTPAFRNMLGKRRWEVGDTDDELTDWKTLKNAFSSRELYTDIKSCIRRKDGSPLWVSTSGRPLWDDNGVFLGYRGTAQDVTERTRTHENLLKLSQAIEQNPAMVIFTDVKGTIEYVNPEFTETTGYTLEEIIGQKPSILQAGETPREIYKEMWDTILSGNDWRGEFRNSRKDGSLYWVSALFSPLKASDGTINNFLCIEMDITERKEREEALTESEDRLQDAVSSLHEGFVLFDKDDRLVLCNEVYRELYPTLANDLVPGIRFEDLLRLSVERGQFDLQGLTEDEWIAQRLEKHRKCEGTFDRRHTDGQHILYNERRTRDGGIVGTRMDITDLKQAEAKLIQSTKLASLGEMATGAAHEINQPLNIIRMSSDAMTERLDEGEVPSFDFLKTRLERISSQTTRAAAIVDRMRVFGRSPLEQAMKVSTCDAVLGAVSFLREELRLSGIELILDIPETCRPVMGDLIQLEQVILNLLTNARDAIEDKVETTTEGEGPDQMSVTIEDNPATTDIKVIVRDTGAGIPEAVLPKIFEPFLTTKEVGKGTGVGLSISYGIVTEMGGTIMAENAEGGAMFTVTLPAVDEEPK